MSTRRSFIAGLIGGVAFARRLPDLTVPSPAASPAIVPIPAPLTDMFIPMPGDKFMLGIESLQSRSTWVRSIESRTEVIDVTCMPHGPVHVEGCNKVVFLQQHYHRMKEQGLIELVPYDADFADDCYEDYPKASDAEYDAVQCTCTPHQSTGYRELVPGLMSTVLEGRIGAFDITAQSVGAPIIDPVRKLFPRKGSYLGARLVFEVTRVTVTTGPGVVNGPSEGYDKI